MRARALLGAVVVSLLAASTATAAPAPIEPVEVQRAEDVYSPRVGLAADGSGEIVFGEMLGASKLGALARGSDGTYGPLQELTRTHSAEAPPSILFEAGGQAFAAWGIASTGATAEWARRGAGGLFGAVGSAAGCGRFLAYDAAPDGTIALACSATQGTAPNDDVVRFGEFGPSAESVGAGSTLSGAGVDDNFIQPQLAVGADGTLAVGWYQRDETSGIDKVQVRVRPAGAASFEPIKTLVEASGADGDFLDDIEVLPDGTVLALVSREPGLELYSRPPGTGSAWSPPQALLADEAFGELTADAAGRVTIAVAHGAGGMLDPRTIAVATRPPGGAFGPFTPIASGDVAVRALEAAPNGTTLLAWGDYAGTTTALRAVLAAPGAGFGPPLTITAEAAQFDLALEPAGNVLAAWGQEAGPDDSRLMVGGIDSGAPPSFASVEVPARALAGAPARLSASARDWSGLREIRWTLPGGEVLRGATVTHAFPAPGTATVVVTAVDRAGNEASASRQVRVVAEATASPAVSPSPLDRRKPRLSLKTRGKLKLAAFLRGVRARLAVGEPSRVEAELLAHARSAHVSAAKQNLVLASRQLKRVAGKRVIRLRPQRRLLGRAHRFRVVLRVTATDAAGNERVVRRSIRVG